MPSITNKTNKPLKVPLPQGKTLFLGPGRSGQVTPKALEHPPFEKLVEAGEIEVADGGSGQGRGGGSQKGLSASEGHTAGGGVRHTGDR